MGTRHPAGLLQSKIWQLDQDSLSGQGYLYNCSLCDEVLVLSKQFINPRKVQLVFENTCPGCGFELEKTLKVQPSLLPPGKKLLTHVVCKDAEQLIETDELFEAELNRGSNLQRDIRPDLITGIQLLDQSFVLRFGQLISLQGGASNPLSHLLCVRAICPLPPGLDSDVVFFDGGNLFDAYTVSQHASSLGMDIEKTKERIHLSRAFTHHQLSSLITEKLGSAVGRCDAKLAVVSDITALYRDPDVREKREAADLFSRDVRSMAMLAEKRKMIIVVTNLKSRSKTMDKVLERTAHVSATLQDNGAYTKVTITRHPFVPEGNVEVLTLDNQTLTRYLV
jgi:hypothetical protein